MSTMTPVRALLPALAAALPLFAVTARPASYPCYWVKGRLMAYNGNPTFRIWPTGTNRLLGVVSPGSPEKSIDDWNRLPAKVRRFNPVFGRHIWGEFRVCPRDQERPGWMRMVVLVDGRRMRVVDYNRRS